MEPAKGLTVPCDLAELEYAYVVGESETAMVSPDISLPNLVKSAGLSVPSSRPTLAWMQLLIKEIESP